MLRIFLITFSNTIFFIFVFLLTASYQFQGAWCTKCVAVAEARAKSTWRDIGIAGQSCPRIELSRGPIENTMHRCDAANGANNEDTKMSQLRCNCSDLRKCADKHIINTNVHIKLMNDILF